ncbi:hypothetical protein [Paenibacillus sp. GCM10012306]|uniref:hypothetical protein n=1 Tax=Paenibacillus sp. GCM10012306 TaxID=3317342 RepID=UPI00360F636E
MQWDRAALRLRGPTDKKQTIGCGFLTAKSLTAGRASGWATGRALREREVASIAVVFTFLD